MEQADSGNSISKPDVRSLEFAVDLGLGESPAYGGEGEGEGKSGWKGVAMGGGLGVVQGKGKIKPSEKRGCELG